MKVTADLAHVKDTLCHKDDQTLDHAIGMCSEILDITASNSVFDSTFVVQMQAQIEGQRFITEHQLQAIENIHDGWVNRYDGH